MIPTRVSSEGGPPPVRPGAALSGGLNKAGGQDGAGQPRRRGFEALAGRGGLSGFEEGIVSRGAARQAASPQAVGRGVWCACGLSIRKRRRLGGPPPRER